MLCDTKQEHTVMLCMKTGTKHSIKDENSKDGEGQLQFSEKVVNVCW